MRYFFDPIDLFTTKIFQPLAFQLLLGQMERNWMALDEEKRSSCDSIHLSIPLFPETLLDSPIAKERFLEFSLTRRAFSESMQIRLFWASVAAEYLHRLFSFLPEDKMVVLEVAGIGGLSKLDQFYLLLQDRWGHLEHESFLGQKVGIVLPSEEKVTFEGLSVLHKTIESYKDIRALPEGMIPELWGDLEEIIALEMFLGKSGKRALDGFAAAMGKVTLL